MTIRRARTSLRQILLGFDGDRELSGYDVLLWIEEAVALRDLTPPEKRVHSANPPGHERLLVESTRSADALLNGADPFQFAELRLSQAGHKRAAGDTMSLRAKNGEPFCAIVRAFVI